ncbi:MAG: TetR/AcrR family transcriptional regulator [Caulobacteraceae bacterium]
MVKAKSATKRSYSAPAREQKAAATRAAVLGAARALFTEKGFAATSIADIAARAGVNPDTIYAAVGRKPQLVRELIETAISGADHAVPVEERDYVAAIRACADARGKIAVYARAAAAIQQRLAPVFKSLMEAASTAPDCAALWSEISERRARNMRLFAQDLRSTGQLRADLDDDAVADIVWSMNGPEYFIQMVDQRGWPADRFAAWLEDAWTRLLLDDRA